MTIWKGFEIGSSTPSRCKFPIFKTEEKEGVYSVTFDLDAIGKFREKEKWRLKYQKKNPF